MLSCHCVERQSLDNSFLLSKVPIQNRFQQRAPSPKLPLFRILKKCCCNIRSLGIYILKPQRCRVAGRGGTEPEGCCTSGARTKANLHCLRREPEDVPEEQVSGKIEQVDGGSVFRGRVAPSLLLVSDPHIMTIREVRQQ